MFNNKLHRQLLIETTYPYRKWLFDHLVLNILGNVQFFSCIIGVLTLRCLFIMTMMMMMTMIIMMIMIMTMVMMVNDDDDDYDDSNDGDDDDDDDNHNDGNF